MEEHMEEKHENIERKMLRWKNQLSVDGGGGGGYQFAVHFDRKEE